MQSANLQAPESPHVTIMSGGVFQTVSVRLNDHLRHHRTLPFRWSDVNDAALTLINFMHGVI